MRYYETTFIVTPQLEDDKIEEVIKKVENIIKNKGVIKLIDRWGKKKLAYPIANQQYGFYVHIQFEADGSVVEKLEREYKLNEGIIRYLTVRVDKKLLKLREMEEEKAEITQ